MSHTKFFISDTHFGHANIITFKTREGTPLRDFGSMEEMHDYMEQCWNSVVKPKDTVYHLGDVVINKKALPILSRLHGRKILIKGNHDIFQLKDYMPYFEDIRAYRVFSEHKLIMSHIPIHPDSLERWRGNVHGHLHSNLLADQRYMNVSVEQINYTPISLEEILHTYTSRGM